MLPGVRNLKSAVYKLQFDVLLGSIERIFLKLLLILDTSNMEYDSGVRFSVFPSIFKLIFVHKSFEVHYKSEYKTSRKL